MPKEKTDDGAERRRSGPVGSAERWSDATLIEMSRITPDDFRLARALWRRFAPRAYKTLLDAEEMEEQE